MSTTIDERVVEMRFDNKQFESGAQTTLSTLDKLKQALRFDDSSKALNNVSKAAADVDMSSLAKAADTVNSRFSSLGIMATQVLRNIADSAYNTGKQIIESLTIAPVSDGFREYELKMDSVMNIMNGSGASLDTVMGKLEELNHYADKTIYSFSDMTANIGKFINAGVDLDTAVAAIQGVSNVAALSGANANEASRAMYNFSQALSSGAVKLIDWKSIENANMATVDFKDTLIQVAKQLGTLEESEGKYISTTTDMQGKISDAFDATHGFNDSLSSQWMTTEVLTEALKLYSTDVREMSEAEREAFENDIISKYGEEKGRKLIELGQRAYDAAQDVKTFSQLMDTLKEAVGSGWAQTFEYLIGNFEEAKKLFTAVSNEVGGFIGDISDARNALLKGWHEQGGYSMMLTGIANTYKFLKSIMGAVNEGFREVFPPMTSERLVAITKGFMEFTKQLKLSEDALSTIKSVSRAFFTALKVPLDILSTAAKFVGPFIIQLARIPNVLLSIARPISNFINSFISAADTVFNFSSVIGKVTNFGGVVASAFGDALTSLVNYMKQIDGDMDSVETGLVDKMTKVKDAIKSFIDTMGSKALNVFSNFSSHLGKTGGSFESFFSIINDKRIAATSALFNSFDNLHGTLEKVAGLLSTVAQKIKDAFGKIKEALGSLVGGVDEGDIMGGVSIGLFISMLTTLKSFAEPFKKFGKVADSVTKILDGVRKSLELYQTNLKANILLKIAVALGVLAYAVSKISEVQDPDKLIQAAIALIGVATALTIVSIAINKIIDAKDKMSAGSDSLQGALIGGLDGIFGSVKSVIDSYKKTPLEKMAKALISIAIAMVIMGQALKSLSSLSWDELARGIVAIAGMAAVIAALGIVMKQWGDKIDAKVGLGMIGIAVAIGRLTSAVVTLGSIKLSSLVQGLISVAALVAVLAGSMTIIGKNTENIWKSAAAILAMGVAINALLPAVLAFGNMPLGMLAKGGIAVAAFLLAIGGAVRLANGTLGGAVSVAAIVIALYALLPAILAYSALPLGTLVKGGLAVAAFMFAIAGATRVIGAGSLKAAAAMVAIAVAINILAPAIKSLGELNILQIIGALLTLAGTFAVIFVAVSAFSVLQPILLGFAAGIALIGAGILALAVGVNILVPALAALGVGMVGLAGELVAAVGVILSGLAGLGIELAAAATVLGKAFMTALGALIPDVVNVVGMLLMAIATAIDLYGPGIIAHLLSFLSKTLDVLTAYLPVIATKLVIMVAVLVAEVSDAIQRNAPVILSALKGLLGAIINFLLTMLQDLLARIPGVGDKINGELEKLKGEVSKTFNADEAKEAAHQYTSGLQNGIETGMPSVGTTVQDSMSEVTGIFDSFTPSFNESGSGLMDSFNTGFDSESWKSEMLAAGISEDALAELNISDDMFTTGSTDISQFVAGFGSGEKDAASASASTAATVKRKLDDLSPLARASGANSSTSFSNGIREKAGLATSEAAKVATGVGNKLDTAKSKAYSAGNNVDTKMKAGIDDNAYKPKNAASSAVSGAISAANRKAQSSEASDIGRHLMNGLKAGILAKASSVAEEAANAVSRTLKSMRNVAQVKSPSRATIKIGDYMTQGLIIGLKKLTGKLNNTAANVTEGAIDNMKVAISEVSKIANADIQTQPVVRPVLDLSEVQNGSKAIDNLFGSNYGYKFALAAAGDYSAQQSAVAQLDSLQSEMMAGNSKVVASVDRLYDEMAKFNSSVSKMQMVMDTGKVVGAIAKDVDRELGKYYIPKK